ISVAAKWGLIHSFKTRNAEVRSRSQIQGYLEVDTQQ
ncbi:hypothetical protein A2U01_0094974, partial [Trifolium medium]|nr:hypothetical protein [Trifolium medium]